MAFELNAGHPALDLVNTLDWRFGDRTPEDLLPDYADLVGFAQQSKLIHAAPSVTRSAGQRVLRRCIQLREALAEVFYARLDDRNPSPPARRTLERYFKALRSEQQLDWTRAPHLAWDWSPKARGAELPLWALVASACALMTSEAVERVRACNNSECRWLFLDTSKNHTRRWCDMAVCGNRIKARRFRAQRGDSKKPG
jgi:predicted RNA-binding Zn ribbon-like protein